VISFKVKQMNGKHRKEIDRWKGAAPMTTIVGDGELYPILGSIHGFQFRFVKCHETLILPVSRGASFSKRAGDISTIGR
jgi:hypothetical protein